MNKDNKMQGGHRHEWKYIEAKRWSPVLVCSCGAVLWGGRESVVTEPLGPAKQFEWKYIEKSGWNVFPVCSCGAVKQREKRELSVICVLLTGLQILLAIIAISLIAVAVRG